MIATKAKPAYNVPSMAEIASISWNGRNVVSTFSGAGGSCLGYRMAGYRVLWANEFISAARDTYEANHPGSILDARDIRAVKPEEILQAIGMQPGQLDLLDGSPPCASFSTAGKRQDGWGKVKAYSDTKQRTDDLFFEYARILKGLQPKVFIAENVSGLVKGTAKGYFLEILAALKACGYRVRAKVLDAQWLGVPQMRQRLIFIGVREDLRAEPKYPKPFAYRYSVRDAIPWIATGQMIPAVSNGPVKAGRRPTWDATIQPSPTVIATSSEPYFTERHDVEAETDISHYAIGREWDKIKPGEQHPKRFSLVKPSLDLPCNTIDTGSPPGVRGNSGIASRAGVVHPTEKRKFSIAELKRICAFPDDFILTGSYAQQWERLGRAVPPLMMRTIAEVIRDEILCKLSKTA